MDEECRRLLAEKDKEIEELKKKIIFYELKLTYQGIIDDNELERIVNLPPEQIVIEIGKLLKENKKRAVERYETVLGIGEAMVGVDLAFTQKYDFDDSDVIFVSKNIMSTLGINEGEYVEIKKDDVVQLKAISYSKKPNFVIMPTWAKNKINAKVKDVVKISKAQEVVS